MKRFCIGLKDCISSYLVTDGYQHFQALLEFLCIEHFDVLNISFKKLVSEGDKSKSKMIWC
jgi:hypothetical protein